VTSNSGRNSGVVLSPESKRIRSTVALSLSSSVNAMRSCVVPVRLMAARPAPESVPTENAPLVAGVLIVATAAAVDAA